MATNLPHFVSSETDLSSIFPSNSIQEIEYFWGFKTKCLFLSDLDPSFSDYFENINFSPLVVVSFYIKDLESYFCICCEDFFCIIDYHNFDFFNRLIPKFKNAFFLPCEVSNVELLQKIYPDVNLLSASIEDISVDVQHALKFNLKEYEFKCESELIMTVSKFFSISLIPIVTFFFVIQRFRKINPDVGVHENNQLKKYTEGDFVFLRILGSGGYGTVYLAFNKATGFIAAIKKFNLKQQWQREKTIYQTLNHHKFIIDCYGFIIARQKSLVLEYIAKGDLRTVLKKNELSDTQKTKIVLQVLSAIDYMHAQGIMHRDIKAANILLNDYNDAFLSDFDLSRQYMNSIKTTADAGSFCYRSPEQMAGEDVSFQTDLYSFGLLIYEVATLNLPFDGLSLIDMIERITSGDIPKLSNRYGKICKIYEICTSLSIERRAGSFYILKLMVEENDYFKKTNLDQVLSLIKEISHVEKKDRKDVQFLQEKADQNHGISQLYLGVIYMDGNIVTKDEKKGFKYFKKAADQGINEAIYNVAVCYGTGKGTKNNESKSFIFLKKAAKCGVHYAQHDLAVYYENGRGTECNLSKAFKYFKMASEKLPDSMFKAANMLIDGIGVEKNEAEGYILLGKAAKVGNENAIYDYGNYLISLKQFEKAIDMFKKLIKHNDKVFIKLGVLYYSYKNDLKKAIEYFNLYTKKAGNIQGTYLSAICYFKMEGKENFEKGIQLMKTAATRGLDAARCYYGKYLIDNGDRAGIDYLNMAVDGKISYAHFYLGQQYESGVFVEKNIETATQLYIKAIQGFCPPAEERLKELGEDLSEIVRLPQCSCNLLGKQYVLQHKFDCLTCAIVDSFCLCGYCAKNCHAGHDIVDFGVHVYMFCDCGCCC